MSTDTLTLDPVTALTVPEGLAAPSLLRARHDTRAHRVSQLQQALDRAMPDQIMQLDGKPFRKKGYWRAIAVAFNLTVEPVDERREIHGTLDDGSDNYVYIVTYRAATATQRATTGDGACAAAEKQRGRMRASEHNVRAHAHTRAFNRAVSNLVGFGEVSAEEIEREDRPALRPVGPTLVTPAGFDDWLEALTGTATRGEAVLKQAWTTSAPTYRRYLTTTQPARWAALKATAAAVRA